MNPYRGVKFKADIKLSLSEKLLMSGSPLDKVLLFFISLIKGIGVILLVAVGAALIMGILSAIIYGLYLLCTYNPVFFLLPLVFWALYGLAKTVMDNTKENLNRKLAPKINEDK